MVFGRRKLLRVQSRMCVRANCTAARREVNGVKKLLNCYKNGKYRNSQQRNIIQTAQNK